MEQINLIEKDTILPKLHPYDWDVVIHGKPYYVVKIEGFCHRIGGRYGNNDLWCYPRNEEPSYENLIEFDSDEIVSWGIQYEPKNVTKSKWDECECYNVNSIKITRNGIKFCDVSGGLNYGIDKARVLIQKLKDHPLRFEAINFDKKMIGRKIWWRSEPAIITDYIFGQNCVIIEPDGIDQFTTPAEFKEEDGDDYYEEGFVKTDVFDENIWWFRD